MQGSAWRFVRSSIAVALIVCAVVEPTAIAQGRSNDVVRLDKRIGPPVSRRWRSILVGEDWKNPFLIIGQDGIDVIAAGLPSGRRTVARGELQQTLVDLPVTAWPYGRVVAVAETGLRAPDRSDEATIAENLKATLAILKGLRVTANRWPSA